MTWEYTWYGTPATPPRYLAQAEHQLRQALSIPTHQISSRLPVTPLMQYLRDLREKGHIP